MRREEILFSLFDPSGHGLEIGPAYSPLMPKSRHDNVETLDYADQVTLREKYKKANVDIGLIEEPTYVSDGRPISAVVGVSSRYDFVIASHVIEHTIDLIGFLNECERILKPSGRLVLAVPDKRFCFDFLRSTTSTAQVLYARQHGSRKTHTPETYFDSYANACLRDGQTGWTEGYERDLLATSHPERHAVQDYLSPTPSDHYRDEHAWVFTPSSFRLILHDLAALQATRLKECAFVDTVGIEFFAALSAGGAGSGQSRLDLARNACEELAAPFVRRLLDKQTSLEARLSAAMNDLQAADRGIGSLETANDGSRPSPGSATVLSALAKRFGFRQ